MSETLLLDTDVASFLLKRSRRAEPYRSAIRGKRLALSFMSVAEMYKWAIKRDWGTRKMGQLRSTLRRYVIIPYDNEMAWAWARVTASCEKVGRSISPSDAWIAATALRHDMQLATGNIPHFEAAEQFCELRLLRIEP